MTPQQQSMIDDIAAKAVRAEDYTLLYTALAKGASAENVMRTILKEKSTILATPNVTLLKKIAAAGLSAEQMLQAGIGETRQWIVSHAVDNMGADVNATVGSLVTSSKKPVIHWAQDSSFDILEYLLKKGIAVDTPDDTGQTVLMKATISRQSGRMKAYIDAGADPLCVDNTGEYPLKRLYAQGSLWSEADYHSLLNLYLSKSDFAKEAGAAADFNAVATDSELQPAAKITVGRGKSDSKPPENKPRDGSGLNF